MLHTFPYNGHAMERSATQQPSVTSSPSSQSFHNTKSPYQSHTLEFHQRVMPQWTSFMPMAVPSPSDEQHDPAALDYFWKDGPLISALPQLDSRLSDTDHSEDMYSLFSTPPPQHPSDPTKPLSQAPPYMTADSLRSLPFTTNNNNNNFSSRTSYLAASDPEDSQSQMSDTDIPQRKSDGRLIDDVRVVHNQVEQRYRHRVRDNINALWNVIPESATTVQPSKAVVLKRAREHILEMQQHVRRDKREKEVLEAKVQMLEHFLSERSGAAKGLKAQNVGYAVV